MKIEKWGDSLAMRLPEAVVEVLQLKEGEEITIELVGTHAFAVKKAPAADDLIARLRKYRGRLPADFRFDRLEAHERR